MTREEAKTFLLQFNTDKRLNPSEHEAIRVAINSLERDEKYAEFRKRFQEAMMKENMFSINSRDFDDNFFDAAESEDKK